MISRYLMTLAVMVLVVTCVASYLPFATNSRVLSGKTLDETLHFEFTSDAGNNRYYEIDGDQAQLLQSEIEVRSEGAPRVVAARTEVTPQRVSWSENRTNYTAPGAAMTVQLRWDTAADSANGSRGIIYLSFPQGRKFTLRSGAYQKDDAGRYVISEVRTYRSSFQLGLARFAFALAVGLPFGIVLQAIGWAFVLKGEKRSRLQQLLPQSGLPQTFFPDPIAEWSTWLLILGIVTLTATVVAGIGVFGGFMSSVLATTVYVIVGIGVAIAGLVTYLSRNRLLTIRVGQDGLSYARGRENQQWTNAAWTDILSMTPKSKTYKGNTTHWMEIEFQDNRKKLKIGQSIGNYGSLCNLLLKMKAQS
ncbi:MAG TPA: hypothetical protein VGF88_14460 [Acidobacteriaceae bacterium]|jgi:hypothetical protein